ncbi:hypothetical protein JR316_0008311 [Psilocybe cubensis]|uniref:F-box domain-containing protein n=2 Tax=Psilocybe cubensis TaxID=181762 RepID=A0A8H8CIH6_PSICU|nr:hypothetical protein JR316_0008311 [Psilocybe cubensis]KAH9479716.1 hypothetical protein JR316_0008311 [Psilocybe cubensis]
MPIATDFPSIQKTKDDVDYIDAVVKQIEHRIKQLVAERIYLNRKRNSYSPAVKLPPELLSLIFQFACLPDEGHQLEYHTPTMYHYGEINQGLCIGKGALTPFFLGTICSAWRQVAQDTSQLWCAVIVYMNQRHADSQAALLKSWLKRSGQRPISVKLVEGDKANNRDADWPTDVTDIEGDANHERADRWPADFVDVSSAVINVLASHSKQWHTIDIFVPHSWKLELAKVRHNIPLLTSLTLRVADTCPSLAYIDVFAYAPQLHSVHLVGYSVTDICLPWKQLCHLEGEYFSSWDCLKAMHLGVRLRKCQFEQLCHGLEFTTFNSRPIKHEYLTSFELLMKTTHELDTFLSSLMLPNLKELVVSLSDEESLLWPIIPLMRRSDFKLQLLHLLGTTPDEEQLIGFLKVQPWIKSLILLNPLVTTGGTLGYSFIEAMTPMKARKEYDQPIAYLLPMLEHFEYQGATSFTPHSLVRLLSKRWQTGAQILGEAPVTHRQPLPYPIPAVKVLQMQKVEPALLRSVTITISRAWNLTLSDTQIVQRLEEEGMHIQLLEFPSRNRRRRI